MYARQSESFKDEECKSEGGTQRGLYIKAKKRINDSNNFFLRGGGGRESQQIPIYYHTCHFGSQTVRY